MSIQTGLPTGGATDGTANGSPRFDQYQAAWVTNNTNKETNQAAEGSYYLASSPTPGTGIIGHAAPTTYDQTKPYLYVYNGSSLSLYPQFVHFHDTVVSVGGARVQFTVSRDVGNLYSSGGTASTIVNTSSEAQGSASGVLVYQGAVVITAATASVGLLGNYCLRGTIDVVEDDYQLVFGAPDGAGNSSSRVATVAECSRVVPPVRIGPGKSMKIVQWAGSQSTGPTFEMVFGFTLR